MEALNKSILDFPACSRQVPVPQETLIQSEFPYETDQDCLQPAAVCRQAGLRRAVSMCGNNSQTARFLFLIKVSLLSELAHRLDCF